MTVAMMLSVGMLRAHEWTGLDDDKDGRMERTSS